MKKITTPLLIVAILVSSLEIFGASKDNSTTEKISKPGAYQGYTTQQYKGFKYDSRYIKMRDSVPLAADIFLPKGLEKGKKVPTILYLNRYVRSIEGKPGIKWLKDPILATVSENEIKFFTSYGYAVMVVDVRGTGASFGERKMEFSPQEVADGTDIVNWIIAQKWSDGNVGSTGVSYLGTTAEMLLANKHPNVKACIPRSAIFDLYSDMIFPGGVCHGAFVDVWGATTKSLDHNDFSPFGNKARKLVRGIHPVKGDKKRTMLNEAVALHKKNFDVSAGVQNIRFRDDIQPAVNACMNDFSVHSRLKDIEASGTPIYRIDGWYDGGLAKGAIDGWLNTSNTKKVLIGPWDHGPHGNVSPWAASQKVGFNVKLEMLRFFDRYLKGIKNGIDEEPVMTYYSVGDETWKTTSNWPVKNEEQLKLFFSADKNLETTNTKIVEGPVTYNVDYTASSGNTTRWNSLTEAYMHGPSHYPDRRTEDEKLLSFTSEKLTATTEIAGAPVVSFSFAANANDATVFCYLEDVAPDSSVTYVSEGMLRPMQSKLVKNACYKTCYPDHTYKKADAISFHKDESVQLTFDLLPIAYQFKKDHKIRISIAGSDIGHFNLPEEKPTRFVVNSNKAGSSYLELPVVKN